MTDDATLYDKLTLLFLPTEEENVYNAFTEVAQPQGQAPGDTYRGMFDLYVAITLVDLIHCIMLHYTTLIS